MAQDSCQRCLNDMHARAAKLSQHPSTLSDFCAYMVRLWPITPTPTPAPTLSGSQRASVLQPSDCQGGVHASPGRPWS